MNKGPNQPQPPGNPRRRRRRRGSNKKKQGGPPGMNTQGPSQAQPGGGGAHRRQNRNRRPAAFVGPMDHSYRNGLGQNGNIDPEQSGRFRSAPPQGATNFSNYQQQNLTPVVASPDAPARIFCFIDDLFFLAKIQETARKLNIKVEFVKAVDPILDRAQDTVPEAERPTLVIFDLNNLGVKPLTLIPKLRSKLKKSTSIIGFVSHIQGDLKMKAIEAGCDVVMPRSAFSQNLPQLIRRHGAPEDQHLLAD